MSQENPISKQPLIRRVNRQQMSWRAVDVEHLISEYDPAFQWLTGWEEVNYHTLADFRVEKQKELDELFTQVLAALSQEGLITLEQVMQDGTKIKALASSRSYLQEETIREHLDRARRRVTEMGDPRNEEASPKAKQAQARARR